MQKFRQVWAFLLSPTSSLFCDSRCNVFATFEDVDYDIFPEASGADSFLIGISVPGLKAYEALRGEKYPPHFGADPRRLYSS
jgi:hypothetical protein